MRGHTYLIAAVQFVATKGILRFPLELPADLAVQCLLVGFHRQQEAGPLLLELLKHGLWVSRAFA